MAVAFRLPDLRQAYLPWRKPQVESGPVRLSARRLYILPTRAGLVFGLLLGALLVGAINYSLSLAYLFTFLLAGIGLAGMIHTQRNLHGIVVRAAAAAPVFAGEPARLPLRLDNPSALERFRIAIEHASAAGSVCDLPAHGSAELTLTLAQPGRGWRRPGRFVLCTAHPLGLFRCWTVLELDWGVLVYPRPAAEPRPLPWDDAAGESGGRSRAGGEDFDGLREYRAGDPLRRIAWKAAARRLQPVTKHFASPAGQALWLDWARTPERDDEARLSRLARWALDAERAGLDYGLRLPGGTLPPARGERHLRQVLERLARHGEA